MASSHQKGNYSSIFLSKSPHFFKIILHDTLRTGKLGIPTKFVRKYGNGMSSPAFLRVPTGAVWKVELIKCDGKFWLQNGWQEFSNHYSLELGHLLVFGYEGKSSFNVIIFDKSASEIEYPYISSNNGLYKGLLQQNIEESEDDDSVQILEDISSSRKMREKPELPCPRPHKKTRSSNSAIKTESHVKSELLVPKVRHNGYPDRRGCKGRQVKADLKVKVLERASRAFKSENPFFLVVMQPSYVGLSTKCVLSLPANFVRKHLMKEHCHGSLCNSNGKTWTVSFIRRVHGRKLYASIQTGWETFVRDNNIQVGDVCAFELINCIEISFKVVIYQGQDANCRQSFTSTDVSQPMKKSAGASYRHQGCLDRLKAHQKAEAFQLVNAFRSANPYFVVVLQPSYIHTSQMTVPLNFARKYFKTKHTDMVLVLSNGKSWPVRFYKGTYDMPRAKFICGWRRFALDNDLEVGDVCVFELTEGTRTSLKVTIYKKQTVEANKSRENQVELRESSVIKIESDWVTDKGGTYNPQKQHPAKEFAAPKMEENKSNPLQNCQKSLNAHQKAKVFQIASAFRSANPYFVVVLRPSFVTTKLSVPEKFARKCLAKKHKEIILVHLNGKSWPVRYYRHTIERPSGKLCTGWRRFVVDNNLEVGDVCVFELTEGPVTSLNVTIYKNAVEDANLGSSLSDQSGENQVEFQERSVVKIESNWGNDEGGMSSLQNQHPAKEFPVPEIKDNNSNVSGEILDDISVSQKTQLEKPASPTKAFEEASQNYQTLQEIKAIQDTNQWG